MDAPPAKIVCRGVRKAYRSGGDAVEAVRGVDLEIDTSGFYAVMGASGSGKSTLLHLLAALDAPDAGEIFIAGERIDTLGDKEATLFRRERLGVVFQQFNLIPTLTARENVELPGMLAQKDDAWLRSRSDELLGRLGLADRAGHRPDAMSGGEQQRVAIARALLFEPEVVLADEPTGALDSASAERLWSLLAELSDEQGITVLMVTHEPAAAAHCKRVFVVRDGAIAGSFEAGAGTEAADAAGVATRYQQLLG